MIETVNQVIDSVLTDQEPCFLVVDVQNVLQNQSDLTVVSQEELIDWANLAYSSIHRSSNEVTIRLVDEDEITQLNREYRDKDKPTNVLSFPFEADFDFPDVEEEFNLLGDIVICHAVIVNEASEQSKSIQDHYAHMVVHGILHLCGYDHQDDDSAEEMETLEVQILAKRNIANPYL